MASFKQGDTTPPIRKTSVLSPQTINHPSFLRAMRPYFSADSIWIILLMIVVMMRFPCTVFMPAWAMMYRPVIEVFVHAAVGMFALGVLLVNIRWFKVRMPLFPSILIGIIAVSSFMHIFLGADEYTFEGIMLVALPLISFLNFRKMFVMLPWYVAIVWLADVIHAVYAAWIYYTVRCAYDFSKFWHDWTTFPLDDVVSIAGNRNWQAAFLAATTPFACWVAWRFVNFTTRTEVGRFIWHIIFQGLIIGTSLLCYMPTDSRASMLTLTLATGVIVLILFLRLFRHNARLQYMVLAGILLVGVFGGGGSTLLYFGYKAPDTQTGSILTRGYHALTVKAQELNSSDVRIPMWRAATNFIFENQPASRQDFYPLQNAGLRWMTGVGSSYFEDQYVLYRGPDYFTRPSPANRTDYPHNHTFYVAGYLGLPAALAWLILMLVPLTVAFFRFTRCHRLSGHWLLPFWCVVVLWPHAQLDLIMEYWPMAGFLLLSLGLLWRLSWPAVTSPLSGWKMDAVFGTGSTVLRFAGIAFIAWSCWLATRVCMSNIYYRESMILRELPKYIPNLDQRALSVQADKLIWKALGWRPTAEIAYIGLVNAWTSFYPYHMSQSQRYVDFLYMHLKRYNYCDTNWFAGLLFEARGKTAEAEAAYLRQVRVYPVGFRGWLFLRDFYMKHNRIAEVQFCDAQLDKVMAIKGINVKPELFKQLQDDRKNKSIVRTFDEVFKMPGVRDQFISMVINDPGVDLKPWANPNYIRPDSDFPTYDMSRWPDMRFIYQRLKPNLEFDLTVKNDACLAPYKMTDSSVKTQ